MRKQRNSKARKGRLKFEGSKGEKEDRQKLLMQSEMIKALAELMSARVALKDIS